MNLLVPADLVSALHIPDLAVTNGEPGGIWCGRRYGGTRWSRRYVVRLPYDRVAAAKLRKSTVLDFVRLVFLPLYLWAVLWSWHSSSGRTPWPFFAAGGLIVLAVLEGRWRVGPELSRTGRGDLY